MKLDFEERINFIHHIKEIFYKEHVRNKDLINHLDTIQYYL